MQVWCFQHQGHTTPSVAKAVISRYVLMQSDGGSESHREARVHRLQDSGSGLVWTSGQRVIWLTIPGEGDAGSCI